MRKLLWFALVAGAALLAARVALARCLDEDCRPVPAVVTPGSTITQRWVIAQPEISPTPSPMTTDMPAPPPSSPPATSEASPPVPSATAAPPYGCETAPPWHVVDQAVRCAPFWPPPLSAPIQNCPPNLRLICWGYLYVDPSAFQATATLPPPPSPTPPAGYP